MTIDVIIPVYNAAGYVERAVRSALACPHARVILVDDGSDDGSGEICDRLAQEARVSVLHQENRGAAAARNAGLTASAAPLITFLDADDAILPGALDALAAVLGDAQAVQGMIVRGDRVRGNGAVRRLPGKEALIAAMCDSTRYLLCHGWLLRRELLTERFDERLTLGEDGEWLLRTLLRAERIAFAEIPAYRYTLRRGSALRSAGEQTEKRYLETMAAAAPALAAAEAPAAAALYRLTHLLLLLTHGAACCGGLRAFVRAARAACCREPFAAAFREAELTGFSPRMIVLRLLRRGWYAGAYPAIRLRRWMNGVTALRQERCGSK